MNCTWAPAGGSQGMMSQGIIKFVSGINQASGKVSPPRSGHPLGVAIPFVAISFFVRTGDDIMTETEAISPNVSGNRIVRFAAFLYGLVAYLVFFAAFLYAVGFVTGLVVPKTIDDGPASSIAEGLTVNLLLMTLLAVQHSLMGRKQFKQWWTHYVPKAMERSTYVLFASLTLILLFWQWRPMPEILWEISDPDVAATIATLSFGGWVI